MTQVENLPANAGDTGDAGSIPGSGRSPGGGHGYPLQYSCLENPMDRSLEGYSLWDHKELHTTYHTWGLPWWLSCKESATLKTWVRSLGWEDPLEKGKVAHSSILAWRIPWNV